MTPSPYGEALPDRAQATDYVEHLLIWAWRRIAGGRVDCPVMAREFTDACAEDGRELLITYCTFLRALAFARRRPVAVGLPGRVALTIDERRVLSLLAALQADEPARLEAHLRWMSTPARRLDLRIAAAALARALAVNGLLLAPPPAQAARTSSPLGVAR